MTNQPKVKVKGNKLYIQWKCSNNSFNSWIDKSDILKILSYKIRVNVF